MRRCSFILVMISCLLLGWAATTFADAPAGDEPKITLTYADGHGQLCFFVKADLDGVWIRTAKTKEPTLVPWAKVRKVSSGITKEQVVAEWKQQHASELCETCQGDRATTCPSCKGTEVKADEAKPCETCNGTGSIGDCKKCKDGKVPCPNSCLKRYEGQWRPQDGKMARTFRGKHGVTHWFSEAHVGELIVPEGDDYVSKGKCPTCNGTTYVECPNCHGTHKEPCKKCKGKGVTGPKCPECEAGKVKCTTCDGTGLKPPATQPAETPAT
ncbi:MAG: hypothetical protein QM770_11625 [Tepidisphaeraceae bacterium]